MAGFQSCFGGDTESILYDHPDCFFSALNKTSKKTQMELLANFCPASERDIIIDRLKAMAKKTHTPLVSQLLKRVQSPTCKDYAGL